MTIANTAPSVAAATISPEFISTGDTLVCGHVGFFDVDGVTEPDETFYRWTINGIHVEDGPTLTGGFSGGDLIACEAVPFDGEDEGPVVEATTEVSNTTRHRECQHYALGTDRCRYADVCVGRVVRRRW